MGGEAQILKGRVRGTGGYTGLSLQRYHGHPGGRPAGEAHACGPPESELSRRGGER